MQAENERDALPEPEMITAQPGASLAIDDLYEWSRPFREIVEENEQLRECTMQILQNPDAVGG